ncbi:MAG TPA: hypothetical protein VHO70_03750 [Chitinispirillaceae bacterium]|nr:hypothetical protein [Chitinispirillaceae bacterium]
MDIFNIPLSVQIGVLIGVAALYVLFKGLELPKDFHQKEAARKELKQRITELEQELSNLSGDSKK